MARLLVRLKLALLRGRFRGSWQVKVGMVLSLAIGLPGGLAAALALAVAGRATDLGPTLAVLTMSVLTLAWALGPPLLFGVDDTLDPARLAPLPLSRRDLAWGMLAAGTVGVGPLVTTLVLLGLVVGIAPLGPLALVVLAAAVVQLALCLVVSRLVTTVLADALRSRRGRDAAGIGLVLTIVVVSQLPGLLSSVLPGREVGGAIARATAVLGASPLGWLGRAAGDAAAGEWRAVAWLGAGVVLVLACGWAWLASLGRLTTRSAGTTSPQADDSGLFDGPLSRLLPRDRLGAAAAKELRSFARDPRHRIGFVTTGMFGTVAVVAAVVRTDGAPVSLLAVAATAVTIALSSVNVLGVDGPATATVVLAGGDHRPDLRGKNLAFAMVVGSLVLAQAAIVALVVGSLVYLPAALLASAAIVLVATGIGDVSSVLVPVAQPELGTNPFGSQSGDNVTNGLLQVVSIAVIAAGLAPFVVVGAVVRGSPLAVTAVATAAVAVGVVVWLVGSSSAARTLARRGPEILEDLRPS